MKLRWSARTDVGQVRDHNEDSYGVGDGPQVERLGQLLVVCDGMGGHAAGEVASRVAVETILTNYYGDLADARPAALEHAFVQANSAVHSQGQGKMGTTGVAALLHHNMLYVANVGDSRAYLIRSGQIQQISRDHSFVSDQVAAGLITPEEARVSPIRNVITRALGHQSDVMVDLFDVQLQAGDQILLSSDGMHGLVTDAEIAEVVADQPLSAAAEQLVQLANSRGGSDNITVVLATIEDLDAPPPADLPADLPAEPVAEPAELAATQPALPMLAAAEPPPSIPAPAAPSAVLAPPPPVERRLSWLGGLLATAVLAALVVLIVVVVSQPAATPPPPAVMPAPTAVSTPNPTPAK